MKIIFFILFIAGCALLSSDSIKVNIEFASTTTFQKITDVSVIVGSDKFFWQEITAGEVETVTLMPGPNDDRQLTLLYTLDGQQKSWNSPKFELGKGYRIWVKVDSLGKVTERHCLLPCSLDQINANL